MKKILILVFLFIFIIPIIFCLGFYLGKEKEKFYQPPKEIDLSLFWQTWHILHEKFPDKERLDVEKMIQGAISGMVESLNDPNTVFFTPEKTEDFKKSMKGEFEGVGMQIDKKDDIIKIIAPIKETPAYRAGLKAGDKIIKIDNVLTNNMTAEEAVTLIRGPKGSEVILLIFREQWGENREFKIRRELIKVPSLSWELLNENIAHLRIYHFIERTEDEFNITINEILASPAEKIILDLRNNPGGYLNIAKNISGWFLERGQIIVIKDFGQNKEQIVYRSHGPSRLLKYPIVVLINEGSASGSEILAGALRDNRNIKIIGEKSFGKGSIQELVKLKEGASLKITMANWLTPNEKLITNQGLNPDIIVEMTEEDIAQNRDPQLEKAIEIINKIK